MVISEKIDGIEVISFKTDRINALNVDTIRPGIIKLFETPYTNVVIDLDGVNYLDSTAFAMILHLLRVSHSNYCSIRLCGLSESARELFELLQLHKALDIHTDRESCLESYRKGPSY
ncbi:MAG: STAS domain-containing protein [Bacteroidales bacterium]|nr:STAS domain-containing protein [Bacteroidales bacterium]MDT8372742.1 STAS domain-containing protein [Bacteroidales bacterium]